MSEGGGIYGNAELPCELGSGTEGPNESYGHVAGGGMIGNNLNMSYKFQKKISLFIIFMFLFYVTKTNVCWSYHNILVH